MSKNTKTVYVTDTTWATFKNLYGKPSTGAANALEGWLGSRRAAITLLKGKFLREELLGLIDSLNGTAWLDKWMQSRPDMLAAQMEDAQSLDNLAAKWSYDGPALIQKITTLHPLECFFLIEEIAAFWERSTTGGGDLEAFAKTLLP